MIGLIATLAPTIGPTVGGYLTEALSWHWLFFINIVPGIVVTIAALDADRFRQARLFAARAISTGGASSPWPVSSARSNTCWRRGRATTGSTMRPSRCSRSFRRCRRSLFFARVLTAQEPIVDLRAFANRNFALGSLFSFVLGIGLYGLTYLYPVYLAQIRGYDALMIGETMFVSGARHVPDRADRRPAQPAVRSALCADRRLPAVRARHLADDLCDQGLGFLGAAVAADLPRRRPDARHRADHQHRARHAGAGAAQERLRPVQPDAQSRRRHRPCRPSTPCSTTAWTCISRACTRRSTGRACRRSRR